MSIEVIGPDGASTMFPEGTLTSVMQAAMARVYGGPQTAGSALAQPSDPGAAQPPPATTGGQSASAAQSQSDPAAGAAPNLALAPLPSGGGYAPLADAARDAAEPWLDALAADPSPVWNATLGLFSQTKPVRDAAGVVAGVMQNGGVSPEMAGLVADPLTGGWRPPESLDEVGGRPPSAATWLGLYHALPSLLQTDPWTGQALPDADSPENANIANIAGHLRRGFIGDPLTGEGGAIPGYGQLHAFIGDPFSIRAAHDGMDGTLFAEDPSGFNGAWLKVQTPAEQAAARAAVTSEIQDRIENGQILPGQLGSPDAQGRLATMFGAGGAQAIAANGEAAINARLAALRGAMGDPDDVRSLSAALPNAPSGFGLASGALAGANGPNPVMPGVTAPPSPATTFGPRSVTAITPIANDSLKALDPSSLASDPVLFDGGAPNDPTAARSDRAGGPDLLSGLNGATSTSGMDGATLQYSPCNGPPELSPDGFRQIGNARIYPYVTSFIDDNLADAIKLANMIGHGATANEILAISGLEVLYGKYPLASVHGNYFGIHSDGTNPKDYFPGQIGTISTTQDGPLATYDPKTGFYESGLRFAEKMKANVGNADLSDPQEFFKMAHSIGWGTTTPKYMRDIQNTYGVIVRHRRVGTKTS